MFYTTRPEIPLFGDLVGLGEAIALFGFVTLVSLVFRHLALRMMDRWAAGTATLADDLAIQSLRLPSIAFCVLLGLYVAIDLKTAALSQRAHALVLMGVWALLVVSVTAAAANFLGAIVRLTLQQKHLAMQPTSLSITATKVIVWMVGGLVLLGGLGVSITPMVTALGITGLAVSLALQDTLSNFFAGLHLLVDRPIRLGDFIKLETGQEGFIENIGWRTTHLRMRSDDVIIIPNNKLIQSVLINYAHPERTVNTGGENPKVAS